MLSSHTSQRHFRSRTGQQIGDQISAVMDRPDTRGLLVVRDDNPNYILGWIVYVEGASVPIVHFTYVRNEDVAGRALRGQGIAGQLLKAIGVDRTRAVVCTSYGPSSESMRGRYKASVHVPLAEFLKPGSP
jgi:hypothetical protein